jgi:hypothetical protein
MLLDIKTITRFTIILLNKGSYQGRDEYYRNFHSESVSVGWMVLTATFNNI